MPIVASEFEKSEVQAHQSNIDVKFQGVSQLNEEVLNFRDSQEFNNRFVQIDRHVVSDDAGIFEQPTATVKEPTVRATDPGMQLARRQTFSERLIEALGSSSSSNDNWSTVSGSSRDVIRCRSAFRNNYEA